MNSKPQHSSMVNCGDQVRLDATDQMRQVESALDRVIEQTVSNDRERQMDLGALSAVVREFVGQTWNPESVAPAMIEAVLAWRFGHVCAHRPLWRGMAETIGADLLDDVHSRARLELLWKKLGGSVR